MTGAPPNSGAAVVTVMGAGSVGCWVGGRLQAAGAQVHLVGRPRVLEALRDKGLRLSDRDGSNVHIAASDLLLHEEPPATPGLVLLCVKTAATASAAAQMAERLAPGTPVLSLQNGVTNAQAGAAAAPALLWLPGMVPFNIAELAPGHFHRGTGGRLAAQSHPALQPYLGLFAAAGLPLALHEDLTPVLWGKLLLNLNNPVNALSGLPLRAQLLDRNYRLVLAALQLEALDAMRAAGIKPAQLIALPPQRLAAMLRLPTWLFRLLARRMLQIDAQARSSMADDLALGRTTEVDAFCGAVVRLAAAHGRQAPINARLNLLLSAHKPTRMTGRALRLALGV